MLDYRFLNMVDLVQEHRLSNTFTEVLISKWWLDDEKSLWRPKLTMSLVLLLLSSGF